jgi:hypothetical protein
MSQKNTHGWMIGVVAGVSFWIVVWSVLDWLWHNSLASLFSVIVTSLFALVIVLALENKYPSLRNGAKGIALGMVIFALAGGGTSFFVYPQLNRQFNPDFIIVDINYTSNYPTGYTMYARIRNEGIDGSMVVTCTVTRADLNTVSESQTVYLRHAEEKSISFHFLAGSIGTEWEKYEVKIGS